MSMSRTTKLAAVSAAAAILAIGLPAAAQASATVCDVTPSGNLNVCESIDGQGMKVNHLTADYYGGPGGALTVFFHFEITGPWGHWFNSPTLMTDETGYGTYTWDWLKNDGKPTTFPTPGNYCTIVWDQSTSGQWLEEGKACINVHP